MGKTALRALVVTAALALASSTVTLDAEALPHHSADAPSERAAEPLIREGDAFIDGLGAGGVHDKFIHQPGFIAGRTGLNVDGSSSPTVWRGYDFSPDLETLYGVVDDGFNFFVAEIDQSTAVIDPPTARDLTPPDASHTLTDLTIDPVSGQAYVAWSRGSPTSSQVYRLDLATGATTLLGTVPGVAIIDMSMNCDGELYAVDRLGDALVRIDPTTGLATPVGALGVNVEFAQGIDFDNQTGLLNAWLYVGNNTTNYSKIDTSTGAAATFPNGVITGEYEGAIKNGCPSEKCPKLKKKLKKAKKAVNKAKKALSSAQDTGNQTKIDKAKAKLKKAKKKQRKAEGAVDDGNCP